MFSRGSFDSRVAHAELGALAAHKTKELNAAMAQVKETADRLTLAARVRSLGIWDLDIASEQFKWDDQTLRLFGVTRENFGTGHAAWKAIMHPEDLARAESEVELAITQQKEFDTEVRVIWPDGSLHSIRSLALVECDR